MNKIHLIIILIFSSCTNGNEKSISFDPFGKIPIVENSLNKENELLEKFDFKYEVDLPEDVGAIRRLLSRNGIVYIGDKKAIYEYNFESFNELFRPSTGRGPEEIENIYRFDVSDNLIAIAAYPSERTLIKDKIKDTSYVYTNGYDEGVLITSNEHEFIGICSNPISGNFFQSYNLLSQDTTEFGKIFENQEMSLDAFSFYVDSYNQNLFVMGFYTAGYYAVWDYDGNLKFLSESVRNSGFIPKYIQKDGFSFIDTEGVTITHSITMGKDEFHAYTRILGNKKKEKNGSIIDVYSLDKGKYKYSYKLNRVLDSIEIVDDSILVGITQDFKLAVWKSKE